MRDWPLKIISQMSMQYPCQFPKYSIYLLNYNEKCVLGDYVYIYIYFKDQAKVEKSIYTK